MKPLLIAAVLVGAQGYSPEGQPNSFADGELIPLKMNSLTSAKTYLPLDPYRLPTCQPENGIGELDNQNHGQFLAGDRIQSSPYRIKMKENLRCQQLCIMNLGRKEERGVSPNKVVRAIRDRYHNNWILDNIPSASKVEDDIKVTTKYPGGFPVGFISSFDGKAYVYNHVNIEIQYQKVENDPSRAQIIQFAVQPFSIKHEIEVTDTSAEVADIKRPIQSCAAKVLNSYRRSQHTSYEMVTAPGKEPQLASGSILFTYDVIWIENRYTNWSHRWDIYLSMDRMVPDRVHWMSIANSVFDMIVTLAILSCILTRNLYRDISHYRELETDEQKAESIIEFGWKLVHGDVFRPPTFSPWLLASCCGAGSQLLFTAFGTVLLSFWGILHSSFRGSRIIGLLALYALSGSLAGYVTVRIYTAFNDKEGGLQKAVACTAFGFPGILFGVWFMVYIISIWEEATYAVPIGTIASLFILWLGMILVVLCGAFIAHKQTPMQYVPVQIRSSTPRKIPVQPWLRGLPFAALITGFLCFGVTYVESYFIHASIWDGSSYNSFGFLFIVLFILVIQCSAVTVLFNYSQLCGENYQWWWRSFITGGSFGIAVFIFGSVRFILHRVDAYTFSTLLVYFGFLSVVSLGLFQMAGFVGISACLWFNKAMFASIVTDSKQLPPASALSSRKCGKENIMKMKVLVIAFMILAMLSPLLYNPHHQGIEDTSRWGHHQSRLNARNIVSNSRKLSEDHLGGTIGRLGHQDAVAQYNNSLDKTEKRHTQFLYGLENMRDIHDPGALGLAFLALIWTAIIALSLLGKRQSARPGGKIYTHNQSKVQKIMAERRGKLCAILKDPVLLQDMTCRYGDLTSLLSLVSEWQMHELQDSRKDECIRIGNRVVVPWIRMMNICLVLVAWIAIFGPCSEIYWAQIMMLSMALVHMIDNIILYKAATRKGAPMIAQREGILAAVGIPVIEIA